MKEQILVMSTDNQGASSMLLMVLSYHCMCCLEGDISTTRENICFSIFQICVNLWRAKTLESSNRNMNALDKDMCTERHIYKYDSIQFSTTEIM